MGQRPAAAGQRRRAELTQKSSRRRLSCTAPLTPAGALAGATDGYLNAVRQTDQAAGYVLVHYAAREVREVFRPTDGSRYCHPEAHGRCPAHHWQATGRSEHQRHRRIRRASAVYQQVALSVTASE